MEPNTGKRIVSKGAYAARKILAVSLSIGFFVCSVCMAFLLANLPYASYLDAKAETEIRTLRGLPPDYTGDLDRFLTYTAMARAMCFYCLPILLLGALLLWMGSRKSWKTVRIMQPINYANTADLPAPESLVRASSEPMQAQQVVLLRAAAEGQEKHEEQLVRAAVRQE